MKNVIEYSYVQNGLRIFGVLSFGLSLIYFLSIVYPELLVPDQVQVLCLCKNSVGPGLSI